MKPLAHCLRASLAIAGLLPLLILAVGLLAAPSALASGTFGIESFQSSIVPSSSYPATQAGAHPYSLTTSVVLNHHIDEEGEFIIDGGNLKNLEVDLPPGLLANPAAVTVRCSEAQLDHNGACPDASAVGVATVIGRGIKEMSASVFVMATPPGLPGQLGFNIAGLGFIVHVNGRLRTGSDYGISADVSNVSQQGGASVARLVLWGNPSDPAHDKQRGLCGNGTFGEIKVFEEEEEIAEEGINPNRTYFCPTTLTSRPFLTMPGSCGSEPLITSLRLDSWQEPERYLSATSILSPPLTGCGALDFSPKLTARPTVSTADSPSGLNVDLSLPQEQGQDTLAEANLKQAVVTLPPGMVVNPSAADGLQGCTAAQLDLHGSGPAHCPDAAKIGTLEIETPLLEAPLPGSIYIAAQGDNPFHSLLAIYLSVDDPTTGVVIKLAGHVEPDPRTGQLRATFSENPQLPFEDLRLSFFGGPRAALTTPPTCGAKTPTSDLTPWTAPQGADATPSDSFQISAAAAGGPCAATEAALPDKPTFQAGTTTPIAGSYSPFVLKLSRENGSQQIKAIDTTLPEGLVGKLAGIPYCSDAQIAAAAARNGLGQGALEKASPSCPATSEVGTVNVGAGSGAPFYVQGHAYLAGPYKGAPLSLAIITPAVAGPFDLGTVVVRTALYVNPETAQIHAVSDPIPSILAGIPLGIRSIALNMDKPNFTLNPTSCAPKQVIGTATSILGQSAALSSPFQVGACAALGFKPNLAIDLKGAAKRHSFPALKATVTYPKGSYANIARAAVTLPHSEFLEQAHIGTVCTRVQFAADNCPAASVYGHARAITPLLDKPLEGPVYLRSSSHKLPDLVADLNGQIHIVLDGRIDTGKGGGIRNTFENVPDAPVSKFVLEMQGGKKGLLVNSTNICKSDNHATVKLDGQNGKTYDFNPVVTNSCGKKSKHAHKRAGAS